MEDSSTSEADIVIPDAVEEPTRTAAPAPAKPGPVAERTPDGGVQVRSVGYAESTMRAKQKYHYMLSAKDDDIILKGIEGHLPLITIAKKIGCSRKALAEYIHKNADLQLAFTDSKDAMDDLAETKLFDKIQKGDMQALMFYMPRKMRHRGYGDQPPEEDKSDGTSVQIGRIPDEDVDAAQQLLENERAAIAAVMGSMPMIAPSSIPRDTAEKLPGGLPDAFIAKDAEAAGGIDSPPLENAETRDGGDDDSDDDDGDYGDEDDGVVYD